MRTCISSALLQEGFRSSCTHHSEGAEFAKNGWLLKSGSGNGMDGNAMCSGRGQILRVLGGR